MNTEDIISFAKSKGAELTNAADQNSLIKVNSNLSFIHKAILPKFINNLYKYTNSILLGNSCIYGTEDIKNSRYFIPSILNVNRDFQIYDKLGEKTIFGRNDLFLFCFDTLSNCYMLDNITFNTVKSYTEPEQALYDCIAIGTI